MTVLAFYPLPPPFNLYYFFSSVPRSERSLNFKLELLIGIYLRMVQ